MTTESPPVRYRRRHRWPILLVIALLLAGGEVLWLSILEPQPAAASGCNKPGPAPPTTSNTTRSGLTGSASGSRSGTSTPTSASLSGSSSRNLGSRSTASAGTSGGSRPSAGPVSPSRSAARATGSSTGPTTTLGTFLASSTLSGLRPADPADIDLRVRNATDRNGLAGTLTQDLRLAGFSSIGDASADALYPGKDLVCHAEIRFGQAGQNQARTVLMVAPCAQLIIDNRIDQSVDLALGADYDFRAVSDPVKIALKAVHDDSAPLAVIEGQTQLPRTPAPIAPLPAVTCAADGPLITDSRSPSPRSAASDPPEGSDEVDGSNPAGPGPGPSGVVGPGGSGASGSSAASGSAPQTTQVLAPPPTVAGDDGDITAPAVGSSDDGLFGVPGSADTTVTDSTNSSP